MDCNILVLHEIITQNTRLNVMGDMQLVRHHLLLGFQTSVLLLVAQQTADEITDNIDNVMYVTTIEGSESDDFALGYAYIHNFGCMELPEHLEPYFDYEAYGRDISCEGNFYTASNGNIYEFIA